MECNNNKVSLIYTDMENILARFLYSYNSNSLQYIGLNLFLNYDKTSMLLGNEGIRSIGYSSIVNELKKLENIREKRAEKQISLWASPYYETDFINMRGKMVCDIYTYRIYNDEAENKNKCELIISQLKASFLYQQKDLKIQNLMWSEIQSMSPWTYQNSCEMEMSSPYQYPDLPEKKEENSPEDVVLIRNLQNYFFERKMHQTEQLFCNEADPSLFIEPLSQRVVTGKNNIVKQITDWFTQERLNNGYYVFLGITSVPVIEVNHKSRTAEGLFMAESFQVSKRDNNRMNDNVYPLHRCLCLMKSSYRFETDGWKIQSMSMNIIAELPIVNYTSGRRYDRMSVYSNEWSLDNQPMKGRYVEDSYQIESLLSQWVYHCRCGELISFYENYMKNRQFECRMLIRSNGDKSCILCTEKDIRNKLFNMDKQFNQLMYSYHTATTPIIEIEENGHLAKATWFDHSATNLLSLAKTREAIPYMVFVAKYVHEFRKVDDKWYLTDFFWEPLISFPDWEFNQTLSKGFVAKEGAEHLKNPFCIDKEEAIWQNI